MTEQEIILAMAKAMQPNCFWSPNRPAEKRLITMAKNAWNAIKDKVEIK